MSNTASSLEQLVHNLYQELEEGLLQAWTQKLENPDFLKQLSSSISLEAEIKTLCSDLLQDTDLKTDLQEIVQYIAVLQDLLDQAHSQIQEQNETIKKQDTALKQVNQRLDGLEKNILQHQIETSRIRLASLGRCDELQQQINDLK